MNSTSMTPTQIPPEQLITITLQAQHWQIVLNGVQEMPYRMAHPVMQSLQQQFAEKLSGDQNQVSTSGNGFDTHAIRKLDADGDYQFGHAQNDFWHDQVEGVGQAIKTRLLLFFDEWFLDRLEGTRWGGFPISDAAVAGGRILAEHTRNTRDLELQQRIINTQGMAEIVNYYSTLDPNSREFRVGAIVNTIYGEARFIVAGPTIGTLPTSAGITFAIQSLPRGWRAFR